MLNESSQFRNLANDIAEIIRSADAIAGRKDVTVIVEDKGAIENIVSNALSVTGVCVIIGVTGFRRHSNSGELILGSLNFEISILERPAINRTVQGYITAQEMAEFLITEFHWRAMDGMLSRLMFTDMQRDDNDFCNIVRMNFAGECSLGMVKQS